jgi:hypothetical protein
MPWRDENAPWGTLIAGAVALDLATALFAPPNVAIASLIAGVPVVIGLARWLGVKPLTYVPGPGYDEVKFSALRAALATAFSADAVWVFASADMDPECRRAAQVLPACASLRVNIATPCLSYEGGVIIFLPERLVVREGGKTLSYSYDEIEVTSSVEEVLEADGAPNDATVLRRTFTFTNKDGSADLRHKSNPPLELCAYQIITFGFAGSGERRFVQSSAKDIDGLRLSLMALRADAQRIVGADQLPILA